MGDEAGERCGGRVALGPDPRAQRGREPRRVAADTGGADRCLFGLGYSVVDIRSDMLGDLLVVRVHWHSFDTDEVR